MAYKTPTFQDRASLSQSAKLKALETLKNKPVMDPEVAAARLAAREAKEAAAREKREAKKAAEEEARLAKIAAAEAAAAAKEAEKNRAAQALVDAKAARDARYAARKARNKR